MRADQFNKLQDINEKLCDVLLEEADPDKWPGASLPVEHRDAKMRGDRYWSKKNAVATVALMTRITSLVDLIRAKSNANPTGNDPAAVTDEADELDQMVIDAEKEASKLLAKLSDTSKKAEFDKRVHGK